MKLYLATACLCLSQLAVAQELTRLTFSSTSAAIQESINLVIEFKNIERAWCGLLVNFGDGETREIRVEQVPVKLSKTYSVPGSYEVRVEGRFMLRGLKTAGACTGEARTARILVVDSMVEQLKQEAERETREKAIALAERERQLKARELEIESRERMAAAAASAAQAAQQSAKTGAAGTGKSAPKAAAAAASATSAASKANKDDSRQVFR